MAPKCFPWKMSAAPAVTQATSHRRHETINEQVQRQHEGGAAAAPTKLIQNRGKEDREGVPDSID